MSTSVQSAAAVLAADIELGTRIYRVPPGELVVGRNARVDVVEDPDFAASIRERGVLQPITCYVHDGALQVHMGQRRAIVATAQGLPWVPVVVTAPPDEQGRLVEQLIENEHRAPITTADRARAVQQLALIGLSAEQLVRATALRRVDVDHALAVAASPPAIAAAASYPLDLTQAAAVAEFSDDDEVVEALTSAAVDGGFDHVLQAARDERDDRDEHDRVMAELRAAGVTALERPEWRKGGARPLDELRISVAAHAGCPGHAGYPGDGAHDVDGRWEHGWHARYVCTDPQRHHPVPGPKGERSLLDEQVRADRALARERSRQWRTATKVRRAWLREFARERTAPAEAERFIAACLIQHPGLLGSALADQHRLLRELVIRGELGGLGEPDPAESLLNRQSDVQQLLLRITNGSSRRALRLTCALLLAAWEARADIMTWRNPRPEHAMVLGQMAAWGYELCAVEQMAAGQLSLDDTPAAGASW